MPATTLTKPDPSLEPTEAPTADTQAEIFLAPRVVDEHAFRAFSSRLRELVGVADKTHASLDGVSGRGAELLASLEALIHTQTKRAKEIRTTLSDVETRIKNLDAQGAKATKEADRVAGFEKRSAAQLASLSEASIEVVERAETAQRELVNAVENAREHAATLHADTIALAAPKLEGFDERLKKLDELVTNAEAREQQLKPLIESSQSATTTISETAKQLDGLRQQSEQLLSAMRATILECADARDAADSRLERLGTLGKNATTVLETLTTQVKRAEQRAAKITPAEIDLDPIVHIVAERVMEAMESRLETVLAKQPPAPALVNQRMDDTLDEIRSSIEMLSSVTLKLASTPRTEPMRTIPPAPTTTPDTTSTPVQETRPEPKRETAPTRTRRTVALPVGASGELGEPAQAVPLWSWTEGQS